MRAVIDAEACAGHGLCYTMAPQVYTDDKDGFGQVRHEGAVAEKDESAARSGMANCPERAIRLFLADADAGAGASS